MTTKYNTGDTIYVPVRVISAESYKEKIYYRVSIPGESSELNSSFPEEYILDPVERIARDIPEDFYDDEKEADKTESYVSEINSVSRRNVFILSMVALFLSISSLIFAIIMLVIKIKLLSL